MQQENLNQLKATQALLRNCWEDYHRQNEVIQVYREFISETLPTLLTKLPGYDLEQGKRYFASIAASIEAGDKIDAIEVAIEFMQRGPL